MQRAHTGLPDYKTLQPYSSQKRLLKAERWTHNTQQLCEEDRQITSTFGNIKTLYTHTCIYTLCIIYTLTHMLTEPHIQTHVQNLLLKNMWKLIVHVPSAQMFWEKQFLPSACFLFFLQSCTWCVQCVHVRAPTDGAHCGLIESALFCWWKGFCSMHNLGGSV